MQIVMEIKRGRHTLLAGEIEGNIDCKGGWTDHPVGNIPELRSAAGFIFAWWVGKCASDDPYRCMRVLSALSKSSASTACADYFSSFGWDVDSTTEPSIAERMLTFRRYDAVVTDLQFNGVCSTEGLDIVRASKQRGRSPVVVVLATVAAEEVLSEAHAAGADCVLLKPQRLDLVAAQLTARVPAASGAAGDAK